MTDTPNYITTLAKSIVERCNALDLKGKKRDNECLALWIGAIHGARLAGNEDMANHFERMAVYLIAIRGYSECLRLANPETQTEKVA